MIVGVRLQNRLRRFFSIPWKRRLATFGGAYGRRRRPCQVPLFGLITTTFEPSAIDLSKVGTSTDCTP